MAVGPAGPWGQPGHGAQLAVGWAVCRPCSCIDLVWDATLGPRDRQRNRRTHGVTVLGVTSQPGLRTTALPSAGACGDLSSLQRGLVGKGHGLPSRGSAKPHHFCTGEMRTAPFATQGSFCGLRGNRKDGRKKRGSVQDPPQNCRSGLWGWSTARAGSVTSLSERRA